VVLRVVVMDVAIFWDIKPRSSYVNPRHGGLHGFISQMMAAFKRKVFKI
jgi:hypothetical protein